MANDLRAVPLVPGQDSVEASQIQSLDGLRAVAALMVLTTHVAFHTGLVTQGAIGAIVSRFDLGVCIFFLLSGFLLYRPWSRSAIMGRPSPGTRSYLRKRFARVYPAYLLLIVVALGLYPPVAPAPADQWIVYLTLTQVYVSGMEVAVLGQTWSLATEVAFYALLPLVGWVATRRHRGVPNRSTTWQFVVLGIMVLITFGYQLIRSWTDLLPEWLSSFWLPGYLDWFAAGMLLAVAQVRLSTARGTEAPPSVLLRLRAIAHDSNTSLIVAMSCFAIAATPVAGKYFFDGTFGPDTAGPWAILTKHYLYGACAFFLLLPLVLGSANHWYARALASPLMKWLGTISYGIFLWHLLMIGALAEVVGLGVFQGGFWWLYPATIVTTLAVASLSWHAMERPVLRWAHRSATNRRQPAHREPTLARP